MKSVISPALNFRLSTFWQILCFKRGTRVSISDVCPKKDLYHDPHDVIITSGMAVSELVDNDNDNVLPLAIPIVIFLTVN